MSNAVAGIGQEEFIGVAKAYGADSKIKRVIDALCSAKDDREDVLSSALAVIAQFENLSEHGSGYTPDASLGFGSDNAATIADKLLGKSTSAGETRKSLAKMGK